MRKEPGVLNEEVTLKNDRLLPPDGIRNLYISDSQSILKNCQAGKAGLCLFILSSLFCNSISIV